MAANILKQDLNTYEVKKNGYLKRQSTTCEFSGLAPFLSDSTTLEQHLKDEKKLM